MVVGALRLGNAGGAKGPDFWCAFEDGEVEVIGDEPENTINDRTRPRLLCRKAKESHLLHKCRVRLLSVCLSVNPVGEPDALIGHVRFDERGWETERWPQAPSYRAHPRLYSTQLGSVRDWRRLPVMGVKRKTFAHSEFFAF